MTTKTGPNIAGKYRILAELGRGPVGIVYEAVHLTLGHRVAIKVIVEEKTAADPEAVGGLLRQARAAANIKSDYVAHVYDLDVTKEHLPFVVMELLEGEDLAHLLAAGENSARLPLEEAVRYAIQICAAIAEAHSLGIVHGNLKPENVFLQARRGVSPTVKVLDFAVSTSPNELRSLTSGGSVMDEDGRGRDVAAIGTILRRMTSDVGAKLPAGLEAVIAQEPPPSAARLAEELLPYAPHGVGLEEVVLETIAMAKSAASPSVDSTETAIVSKPVSSSSNSLTSTTSRLRHLISPRTTSTSSSSSMGGWGKREWILAAMVGALLLFAGMGVSAMATARQKAPIPASTPP